jgi:hypothetical protein
VRTLDNIDKHGTCCYDLVSLDSKTLVPLFLDLFPFYLIYVFFLLQTKIQTFFTTRLGFN